MPPLPGLVIISWIWGQRPQIHLMSLFFLTKYSLIGGVCMYIEPTEGNWYTLVIEATERNWYILVIEATEVNWYVLVFEDISIL